MTNKKLIDGAFGIARRWMPKTATAVAAAAVVMVAVGALAAASPAVITLLQPEEPEQGPVIFKHWKHQRAFKCFVCHPGLFSQWEQTLFDHEPMEKGKYCGACHDGKVAFNFDDAECEVCHVE